jgi:hypothetical protein
VGYVEGEYVLVSPIETAQIVDLVGQAGRPDRMAGQHWCGWSGGMRKLPWRRPPPGWRRRERQLSNLQQGRRPEEIASIVASLRSAKAQAAEAERVLQRQSDLLEQGISTQAAYDSASTTVELNKAKVSELEANLAVARLPARENEIKAAQAAVEQAAAVLESAEWRLSKRVLSVPLVRCRLRHHPQCRRGCRATGAGLVGAARWCGQAQGLCAGTRPFQHPCRGKRLWCGVTVAATACGQRSATFRPTPSSPRR